MDASLSMMLLWMPTSCFIRLLFFGFAFYEPNVSSAKIYHERFLCHCKNGCNDTDIDAFLECQECFGGWFGPGCQFRDARVESQIEYGNFKTSGRECRDLESANETLLRITLSHEQIISWIRVEVVDESKALGPMVVFRLKENDKMQPCNPEKRLVNGPIVDILCDNKENKGAREVEVQAFVNSTCRVFISQGWDVSLKQPASQSSQYESQFPSLAVDGNNGTYSNCKESRDVSWMVSFNFPTEITYFFIVNRLDNCWYCKSRLKRANISYLDEGGQSHFITRLKDEVCTTYHGFTPLKFTDSWRAFKIHKKTKVKEGLNIAEVSVYGQQHCPNGRYGLGCERNCVDCLPQSGCFVTGACYFCPDDHYGPKCDKQCPAGLSGPFCERVCNEGCEGKRCSFVDGSCIHGCAAGFTGKNCFSECLTGTFGPNCLSKCSRNCDADPSMPCDRKTGRCYEGSACKAGWYGPSCLETCPSGTWGKNCSESCSEGCGGNGTCFHTNGSCLESCLSGYIKPLCLEKPDESEELNFHAILLGTGLAAITLLSVFCFLKKKDNDAKKSFSKESG